MTPTARTRPPVATPSRRPSGVVRATLYDPNVKHGTDACTDCTSIGTTACESGFGVASICVCWAECRNLQRHCLAESSCGVHTGCYTACDVAPVVTRGTNFNGRNAQVDAPATAVPVLCSRHTREIDARPSTNVYGRNAEVARIGERVAVGDGPHASDALICAATHAGTTRRIKPEIDTGPSTLPIARSNQTSRWGFKRLLRASPFKSRSYAGHRCMNTGHERDSYSVVTPARRAPGFRPTDAGGSFFAMRELMAGAQ